MKLDFVKEQIQWVDDWTTKLISDIDEKNFGIIESLGTSINWELGHIIISKYFHAIQSILSKEHKILVNLNESLPINEMYTYYFAGSNPLENWNNRPNKKQLIAIGKEIDNASMQILALLTEKNFEEPASGNPVAKTKYDALTFVFKHQMWHNGQIAMLKRIVG